MTTEKRIEIAQKVAEIINGNPWCRDSDQENAQVRVYLKNNNGYVAVTEEGINIDPVKRASFQDVKDSLVTSGYHCYRA